MRIVYLATSGHLGGAETSLCEILGSVRRAEPSWSLGLLAPADGLLVTRARALGVETRVLTFSRALARLGEGGRAGGATRLKAMAQVPPAVLAAASYASTLRRVLAAWRPDVVHANGIKMHLLAARARPRGSALLWHMHDYVAARPMTARLLKRHVGSCALVLANSHSVAGDLQSVLGNRVDILTLYNGVDVERFAPAGQVLDLDGLAGLSPARPDTIKVGLVATFGRWKGHRVFLEAIARVPATASVRAYIIGGPLYETDRSQESPGDLRLYASQLGLSSRVGFTGFVEEPASAMRALDVVVHASTEPEPFGLTIAEAMACGRAVVASRGGGAAEVIDEEVDALACQPRDSDQLAACIARLAVDPDLRARLGRAARASMTRRFDSRRLGSTLVPLYHRLARQARPGSSEG